MRLPKSERVQTCLSMLGVVVAIVLYYGLPPVLAQAIAGHESAGQFVDFKEYPNGVAPLRHQLSASLAEILIVRVENPAGVRVGYHIRPVGATCAMGWRGVAFAVGEQPAAERYLVVYIPKPGDLAEGECPAGTTAFVSKSTFDHIREHGDQILGKAAH